MLRPRGEPCHICKNTTASATPENANPAVVCSGCRAVFHTTCGGISDHLYFCYIVSKSKPWYCYSCDLDSRNKLSSNSESISKIEEVVSNVNNQIQSMSQELLKIRASDSSWRQEFEEKIREDIDAKINNRIIETIDERIESTISDRIASIRDSFQINRPSESAAPSTIQNSYRKNLVITCVPEVDGENVVALVKKLAKQLGFTQDNFIDNCFRVDKKQIRTEQSKPSTILLKCTTEIARDTLLRCYFRYIKRNQLAPRDIGLTGEGRIYVNEHMNPNMQPLLKKALDLRRENKILQVASHCSYLSVKLEAGDRLIWKRIYNEEDLHSLCVQ